MNPQRTGKKNESGRLRGMEEVEDMDKTQDPTGNQDQEQADPELSIAEIPEICEAQVLAMSGRARAGASSIPECPACGKRRHSHETAGSRILTKHLSGSRTSSKSRKLGRAVKRSPLRKEVATEKDHQKKWGVSALQELREHAASAGGLLDAPFGVAGESQGRGAAR